MQQGSGSIIVIFKKGIKTWEIHEQPEFLQGTIVAIAFVGFHADVTKDPHNINVIGMCISVAVKMNH